MTANRSALARLQQAITVALAITTLGWVTWMWPRSPLAAVLGGLAILFFYSLLLGVEFVLLKLFGADGSTPAPKWGEVLKAWWCETLVAPQVFLWRQPFRWRAVADSDGPASRGRRGVVFVHGFVCNRGFWNPWMRDLDAAGIPFVAVNLEPVFGSIDAYAPAIDGAVRHLHEATGLPPVLVCHSMGGLAARAWLRGAAEDRRVHRVVTIGTPHRGTWLSRFSHTVNTRQMKLDGEWIAQLPGASRGTAFTCWYSNCDNIVFPASTATLGGADNRFVPGAAHVELAFHPDVIAGTRELITAEN